MQAIEEENYDQLPGAFYVRAFIKQYADVIGLNGDDLIEEFEAQGHEFDEDELDLAFRSRKEETIPSRSSLHHHEEKSSFEKALSYLPLAILVLLILFIMVTLLIAINKVTKPDSVDESLASVSQSEIVSPVEPESAAQVSEQSSQESEEANIELAENQIKVGNQVLSLVSEPGSNPVYEFDGSSKDYKITVKALNFVWVGVFEDGGIVVDQTLSTDESLDYSMPENVKQAVINLGYPEGATIEVNGTQIDLPEDSYNDTITFVTKDASASPEQTSESPLASEGQDESLTPDTQTEE